jgi:hypothetical protein
MLEADSSFDEGELGFGKFSRFLMQAQEHGVIALEKTAMGNYRVSLPDSQAAESPSVSTTETPSVSTTESPSVSTQDAPSRAGGESAGRLGPRGGSGGRKGNDGPMLLEGQIVGKTAGTPDRSLAGTRIDVGGLGLPTSERAIVSYLTNSYGGVGTKTAESLVKAFGADVFLVFETEPGRVAEIVPRRAPQVLAEWRADFERRTAKSRSEQAVASEPDSKTESALVRESVRETPRPGAENVLPPTSSASAAAPMSDSSSSAPAPRPGGARRRTRRSPRRPPSSGSDE